MNTTLLERKKQNNRTFTLAYKNYQKGLHAYAYFKTNDIYVTEDLVQSTFTKAWMYLLRNNRIENMKGLLYYILRHLIVDEYRKQKVTSLDMLLERGFEPPIDENHRLIDILDGTQATLLIQYLPERYRAVVHMRYIQDLSLKEISEQTKQSRNAVTVIAHRGTQKLRKLYKECEKNPVYRG